MNNIDMTESNKRVREILYGEKGESPDSTGVPIDFTASNQIVKAILDAERHKELTKEVADNLAKELLENPKKGIPQQEFISGQLQPPQFKQAPPPPPAGGRTTP